MPATVKDCLHEHVPGRATAWALSPGKTKPRNCPPSSCLTAECPVFVALQQSTPACGAVAGVPEGALHAVVLQVVEALQQQVQIIHLLTVKVEQVEQPKVVGTDMVHQDKS